MKTVRVELHLSKGIGINNPLVKEVRSAIESLDVRLEIKTVVFDQEGSLNPDAVTALVYNGLPALTVLGDNIDVFAAQVKASVDGARTFDPVPCWAGEGQKKVVGQLAAAAT